MSRNRISQAAVLSPLAVALVGSFLALPSCRDSGGAPDRTALARALEGLRIWEPRFSGGFPHADCGAAPASIDRVPARLCDDSPAIGTERYERLAALGRRLRDEDRRLAGPEALRVRAVWSLVWPSDLESTNRSIGWLEEAAERSDGEASYLSDLAAAYIVRAQRHDRALDLLRALDAAESAIDTPKPLPEAVFNRNLALEYLGLYPEAQAQWRGYSTLFAGSPWADEARARADILTVRLENGDRPRAQARFAAAIATHDLTSVRTIAEAHSRQARKYLETDYLASLRATLDLDEPQAFDEILRAGEVASQALAAASGDSMAADHLVALRAARSRSPTSLKHFMAAADSYLEGYTRYRQRQFQPARRRLEDARVRLARAGSPLAGWAQYYVALCDYQQFRYGEALLLLERLQEATTLERYPVLAARAVQIRGLIESIQGDPALGIRRFVTALALARPVADTALSAGLETQIAANYAQLGNLEQSWVHLYRALLASDQMDNPLALHVLLEEAGRTALQLEQRAAAVRLQLALTARSQALGDSITIAQALLGRAALHLELGQTEQAGQAAQMARDALEPITAAETRQAVEGDLLLLEGRLLHGQDPIRALAALDQADDIFHRTEYRLRRAETRFLQARAELALGQRTSASNRLQEALDVIEAERIGIVPLDLRDKYFDKRREIFEHRLLLMADDTENQAGSFELAQRLKARTLLDLISQQQKEPAGKEPSWRPLELDEIRDLLSADHGLVDYVVTDTATFVWFLGPERFDLRRLPIGSDALHALVADFRATLIGGGSHAEIRLVSAALFDAILKPVWPELLSTPRVIFVPDEALHLVPFAALWNSEEGRYLVETHEISVVPSAAVLAHTARLKAKRSRDGEASLIVGVSERNQDLPELPPLPMAREEALAVAELWPDSVVLTGQEATKARVLEELGKATMIHFAGHAISHPASPLFSQFLLVPGDRGSGILYGRELLATDLRARLAVLSACSTASGSAASTYGLASLAQILMAAGVPSVLGTLWDTDDRTTLALVRLFHRKLRAGLGPAAALREAQLELANGAGKLSSPARWAAFQLLGAADEPRPRNDIGGRQ